MNWKKIIFSIFILLLFPTISIGNQITVTSYSYDIYLDFLCADFSNTIQHHTYAGNGLGPSIEHAIITDYYQYPSGPLSVVRAGVMNPFGIYFNTNHMEGDPIYASVTAEWNFTPNSNKKNLDIAGGSVVSFGGSGGEVWLSYSLLDTADNHLLVSNSRYFNPPYGPPGYFEDCFDESFVFDVLQNKNYRLTLFAETLSWDGTGGGISASFRPVPEPTTMLLLGSGLIGLAGLRRKFGK